MSAVAWFALESVLVDIDDDHKLGCDVSRCVCWIESAKGWRGRVMVQEQGVVVKHASLYARVGTARQSGAWWHETEAQTRVGV
jgi:hypothetical protein